MHPSIEQLLKVQGTDNEIHFLDKAMVARPRELADDEKKLSAAKSRVDDVVDHIKGVRMEIHRGELEIRRCDEEITKANISLNGAKTNEEFAVLKAQVEKTTEERSGYEEAVLLQLDEIEKLEGMQKQLEDLYAEEEKRFGRKKADVDDIIGSLGGKLTAARSLREQLVQGINPEHLEMYERVLARHGSAALSQVRDQICSGCHMSLNAQEINLLMMSTEIVRCRSCSRLLYLD